MQIFQLFFCRAECVASPIRHADSVYFPKERGREHRLKLLSFLIKSIYIHSIYIVQCIKLTKNGLYPWVILGELLGSPLVLSRD